MKSRKCQLLLSLLFSLTFLLGCSVKQTSKEALVSACSVDAFNGSDPKSPDFNIDRTYSLLHECFSPPRTAFKTMTKSERRELILSTTDVLNNRLILSEPRGFYVSDIVNAAFESGDELALVDLIQKLNNVDVVIMLAEEVDILDGSEDALLKKLTFSQEITMSGAFTKFAQKHEWMKSE